MGENNNNGILDRGEGAMCSACHVADWTVAQGNVVVPAWSPDGTVPPMFTDFTYDIIGVPQNTEFPLAPADLGLGAIVGDIKEIVHFYNTRDIPGAIQGGNDWPEPEYPDTVNMDELGSLGLSDKDEDAIVAFMKTLTDHYRP